MATPTAMITGGSRGIGLAIARAFLPSHRLIIVSRSTAHLETARRSLLQEYKSHLANETQTKLEDRVVTFQADLGDLHSLEDTGKNLAALGDVDVLVNSAGVATDAPLMTANPTHISNILNINLTATIMITRAMTKGMFRRKKGCIINISSVAGIKGNTGQSVYSASKAGIIGFTKSLSRELGSRNIRVNAIAPGYIDTDMTTGIPTAKREEYVAATPLRRFGRPEDIAHAALFISQANFMTGQCLVVDGGLSA
ncbi:3-oxoacyl-reductase [Powellomyces hirtus]|nr:3-oxoacyl-reductase [Powellomyces hirtus]